MAEWTLTVELLAQLIEEVSVLAADHRRKQPREVPRPDHMTNDRGGIKHAVNVLKATARRVHR
jgi:hypothetical protein